jgi:hypothetical protein
MKKLFILIASIATFQGVFAQDDSFYKHALVLSLGFGGEGYGITEKYTINGTNLTTTQTGSAACASYPFGVEYGVLRWLGLGVEFKTDKYIIAKDTVNNYQPAAIGVEYGVVVNFHIVRTHHINFYAGLNLGGSNFTYTLDKYNDQVYGSGGWGDIHAGLRYYFGRFGIYGLLSFPTMNYNLTGNNANWSLGQNILSTWQAKGAAFNLGIQYRLFKPAE